MTQLEYETYQRKRADKLPATFGQFEREGAALEIPLHNQIIAHCRTQFPRWKYIYARPDKKSGIAEGANDFTIFMPGGRTLCVECKNKSGKLTEEQQVWRKEMEMLGHTVHLIRSFDEFLTLIGNPVPHPVRP